MALILVVEDEAVTAEYLAECLQRMGYEVLDMVSSGEEAVKKVEETCPDLVLMDIHLKGEMGGIEAGRRIRDGFGTPIVYLTAFADEATLNAAKETDPFGYILKPFEEREVRATIEMALHKRKLESEHIKAAAALRESEAKYKALFEASADGILIADIATRKFLFANQAWCRMLGYGEEEVKGLIVFDIHPPEVLDHVMAEFEAQARGEKILAPEIPCKKKDGAVFYADINTTPVSIGGRKCNMSFFRDITERKRAEEEKENIQSQLLQAQKMEAIGRLAGGVAHDFNNLLTGILGQGELIKMGLNEMDPLYEDIQEIIFCGERAADLTRQLLLFSRKSQAQELQVIDLNETIGALNRMLSRLIGEDIRLESRLSPDLWPLMGDKAQVEQIIANLAVNARDAMPEGGTLIIETGNQELDNDACALIEGAAPGNFVRLTVADTGVGMDKATVEKIFEPFFTTKEAGKGTGLGLSTVYGVVKNYQGWIEVRSSPGQGSKFVVYLPAVPEKTKMEPGEAAVPEKLQGSGEGVLVVEDEAVVRAMCQKILSRNGYIVFTAKNARQALEIFEREKKNIHVILSDVVLPDKSGLEIIEQFQACGENVALIMCSGYTDEKSRVESIRKKGIPFLPKPYKLDVLLRVIKDAILSRAPVR